jgi:hypothetical protein
MDPHGGTDGKPLESGRDGTLARKCSPAVAEKGKGDVGDSPRGSLELGEWWSGWATKVKWRCWWGSMGSCTNAREEVRREVSSAVEDGRGPHPFIGAGTARGSVATADGGEL